MAKKSVSAGRKTGQSVAKSATILQRIQSDSRVKFIASISGGRHLIDVPVDLLKVHGEISKIRHQSPENVDLLRDSIKKTGDTPVYTPCVYVERDNEQLLHYFITDGRQRYRAMKEAGIERVVVQWIDRWSTAKLAMEDAMSLQWARYAMSENDCISILSTGLFTVKQVADRSPYSESTVLRLQKVADNPWVQPIIKDGVLGYAQFGKFVDACGGNIEKLNALRSTLETKYTDARGRAMYWKNKIDANPRKKWDTRSKARARVATYFKKTPWNEWEDLLKSTDAVVMDADSQVRLNLESIGSTGKMAPVRLGDEDEWESEIAVYNFFGKKAEEILPEDFDEILKNWDLLRRRIEVHRNRIMGKQLKEENPMPTKNPEEPETVRPRSSKQRPKMRVVSSREETE